MLRSGCWSPFSLKLPCLADEDADGRKKAGVCSRVSAGFLQESENFLHRSGRTGRAGRSGTAIAMFMPKEYGYFRQIIKQTRVENLEVIAPPAPRQVMESAAKAVRIDAVS